MGRSGHIEPGRGRGAAVDSLVVGGDAPALLLDGLTEATDWLTDDPGLSRPVLVVVSGDVATFSSDPATQFESLAERLRRHGVTTHALIMTTPRPASLERQMSVPEALGRDLNNFTGGEYTTILLGSGLEPSLGAFAVRIRARSRELARQHLVRFERPPGEAPGDVQVTVRRLGARYSVTTDGRVNSLARERLR